MRFGATPMSPYREKYIVFPKLSDQVVPQVCLSPPLSSQSCGSGVLPRAVSESEVRVSCYGGGDG